MEMAERDDGTLWPWAEDCENGGDIWFQCPFGQPGDRIWVQETLANVNHDGCPAVAYRADSEVRNLNESDGGITLEITAVRVERLNSINEESAQAEGVSRLRGGYWKHYRLGWTQHQLSARGSFVTLWKSIYGEESWQANPWVWVIEFRRIDGGAA